MMKLSELQHAFQARVLHGTRGIEAEVCASASGDADMRLGIYEEAFLARLNEALTDTYPALRNALGAEAFAELTRAFAASAPPRHFSIRYFGSELPAFIAAHFGGLKARTLADLARWEWALSEAFDAPDETPLEAAALAGIAPEEWGRLCFRFSASLRRLRLESNAVQWWRAASEQGKHPTRWRSARGVEWAIWRANLGTYFRSLPSDETWALDAAAAGQPFAAICEGLSGESLSGHAGAADPAVRAATLLRRWIDDQWLSGVIVGE